MAEGYFAGLMSGTSLDSIDCAIIHIDSKQTKLVATNSMAWPEDLKNRLKHLAESSDSLDEMLILDQLSADYFAKAVIECIDKAGLSTRDILAIGSHGQTVRHSPDTKPAYTLQIGHPARIAERTGITTVGDFRSRDIAANGQGAPFAPAFHDMLFNQDGKKRAVINIGGIANITAFTKNKIVGYDTGPGNRLLDDWMQYSQNKAFDANGDFAASGETNEALLSLLLADTYFKKPAPKSTGSDYFNLDWLHNKMEHHDAIPAEDIQATLSSLTARSISAEISKLDEHFHEVLICGGGAHNQHLINDIQKALPSMPVYSTDAHGISPDWIEAMAFAWLAFRTLNNLPGNLPDVTGADGFRICGAIYPA